MDILKFLKGIGHFLASAFKTIRELVPEEQLVKAIELGKEAAIRFESKPERQSYVAEALKGAFHISTSVANLIVEMAVQEIKKQEEELAKKAEAALSDPAGA